MAISFVGSAAGTTTFTSPTHKIGDLFIAFAFRDGSTTNPTIGTAGWTSITNTTDGTLCSVSAAWKRATTTSEASGTWTNASRIVCVVYRGQLSSGTPIGTFAPGAGTTDPVNYAARALTNSNVIGSSWFVAFAAHRSVDTSLETPPTNMFLRQNNVDATAECSAFDTNGPATANWPSTNVTVNGTASGWQTMVIEIKAQGLQLNNYKFPSCSVGNTGIISLSEKIK
jgi:hypothetical protein